MAKAPYKPISRKEFSTAWRNLRIGNLHFDKSATANGLAAHFQHNAVGELTKIVTDIRVAMRMSNTNAKMRETFCKAAGITPKQFAEKLKRAEKPEEFAYDIIAGYNTGKTPKVHFTIGGDPVRRYCV